jgi:hypothetical protein
VVTENPTPVVSITQSNDTLFSSEPGPALQWFRNGTALAGQTGTFLKMTQTGNYYVRLTSPSTGCQGFSDTVSFTLGLEESLAALGVGLYPNPTDEHLHVAYTGTQPGIAMVTLRTLTGQAVLVQRVELSTASPALLNVAHLPAGLYLAEVLLHGHRAVQRVVVQ